MTNKSDNPVKSAVLPDVSRRDFLKGSLAAAAVAGGGMGAFYFGYGKATSNPVRVGVIGTGDEGCVLIGAMNPDYLEVRSIADIRPYSIYRAFHGEVGQPARPGLLSVFRWKDETEALRHVKVYGPWQELLDNAKEDGLEAVVIALPLFLHAPVAIAAMQRGLHVLTEKLMGHSVHECKEMARVAKQTGLHLATGHQRHYNILYAQAAEKIQRGVLGDVHYIRAQWHRSNLPGRDSWQQPLPPGIKDEAKAGDLSKKLAEAKKKRDAARGAEIEKLQKQVAQLEAQIADAVLHTGQKPRLEVIAESVAARMAERISTIRGLDGKPPAEELGYQEARLKHSRGVYHRPAIEELIRWRLWDRTAAGLMAELGSHQLDAASIFVAAAHQGQKQHPLSVVAAANRPIFPPDRDCEDHVFCIIEFPAPGYDPHEKDAARKRIGVMYSSINGNGFGGYGEIVFGTKGTLILEREQLMHEPASGTAIRVARGAVGPTLDTQASGPARALATSGTGEGVSRGYAEELEHWAWCIRNPAPENKPRCHPVVALGDAVIALVTNMAGRQGKRIEFQEAWFDPDRDETPEGVKPDLSRYQA